MNNQRFVIVDKVVGFYCIPVIETRTFDSPKRLGSYCANDGSLWTSLNDGKRIFENENDAIARLNKIKESLFGIKA